MRLPGSSQKALVPGDDPGGLIVTPLIGVAGALIGGFVARFFGLADQVANSFDMSTWLTAIAGAVALLVVYRVLMGRAV